ncbi:unnamed protein product [Lepeophtheirus salmonis]|uniref:(salmon louse) hypothetical protein n=1 Tax=Lepeophtheirus salmonis TaxID=72036 RepID=A0A817FA09_LEPSM|nr:unnamed protein product [Lepeophtheirus salmonis]CAG9475289.1 unnamed protein product [Lepeophtheirus salmonis]
MDSIALSKRTVVRRAEKISDDLMNQVKDASKQFLWYLLALDESTDVQDTVQLLKCRAAEVMNDKIKAEHPAMSSYHFTASSIKKQKYHVHLNSLAIEFGRRFQDFKYLELRFNMPTYPFTTNIDLAPEDLQLELRDFQANNVLKERFKSDSLPDFYTVIVKRFISKLKKTLLLSF